MQTIPTKSVALGRNLGHATARSPAEFEIEARNAFRSRPLHVAASAGALQVAKALLRSAAVTLALLSGRSCRHHRRAPPNAAAGHPWHRLQSMCLLLHVRYRNPRAVAVRPPEPLWLPGTSRAFDRCQTRVGGPLPSRTSTARCNSCPGNYSARDRDPAYRCSSSATTALVFLVHPRSSLGYRGT